jgi:hypothetical protein
MYRQGDERPSTTDILERKVESLDRQIVRWKPTNAWDAANQRPLRYMKKRRTELRKALDRKANKDKELRRNHDKDTIGTT